jgi:lipopolysaccharide transport system ATP-binding protein
MSKPIIEVRNLSKKYKIGERQRYLSLRDSVSTLFSRKNTEGSEFWALNDVSFDIHAGESIGIIGRNGAGKSTLLKILSRITPPTKGSVILRGRMASLLEVGTGFHSELTGRENVFMNGSILGLKKREIEAKFDEIVDFSGVEQFIDTPLKHYSSGMQLRLAFAVAAHLEPEILVIDEVLAVGDAEFQKRCLGKMDEVSRSGRTVLFVSHNLGLIQSLCSKGILLIEGRIESVGKIDEVTRTYLLKSQDILSAQVELKPLKKGATFRSVSLLNYKNSLTSTFRFDEPINLRIEFELYDDIKNLELSLSLSSLEGLKILYDSSLYATNGKIEIEKRGKYSVLITLPSQILLPNSYTFNIALNIPNITLFDHRKGVIGFSIEETGKRIECYKSSDLGIINLGLNWSLKAKKLF